ncbi:MAG: error-prone DNA polymerase [Rhodoblastus sp.]
MTYAELATATNFSFLRGASHPEELVATAVALGHAGIGIADRNSVAGVVRAHVYAREKREEIGAFKVVAGARLVFADGTPDILAYPQDRAAWGRLCRMLTQANARAQKGKSLLRLDDLLDWSDGLLLIAMERSSASVEEIAAASKSESASQPQAPSPTLERPPRKAGDSPPPCGEGPEARVDWVQSREICPPATPTLPSPKGGGRAPGAIEEPGSRSDLSLHREARPRLFAIPSPAGAKSAPGSRLSPTSLDVADFDQIRGRDREGVAPFLHLLKQAAPGRLWLALSAGYGPHMRRAFAQRLQLARESGLPLVAVNDAMMHAPERRAVADVLTCIREGRTLDNAGRLLAANAERHLKSAQEMRRLFRQAPEAVAETTRLLDRIAFSLDELAHNYPSELREGFASEQEALEHHVAEGAKTRWPNGVPAQMTATIQHELKIVAALGYAAYFLTVHHIVRYARGKGILAQGRGSAANSTICYCLQITEVDPLEGGLLFERFMSKQRNEPPDIDVDFEHERREEVIEYIYAHYGRDRAALTATVTSYRGRSAIRETAKVFGFSDDVLSTLSGSVWGRGEAPGGEAGARAGLDPSEPRLARAIELAHEISGFPRHLSQHTGGFVITRDRLDEIVPILPAAMEGRTTIEWDKDDLDALRILKIDILALGMLTALRKGFALLEQHYETKADLSMPPRDKPVYDMISRADTIGVFQIESRAQMSMLPRLKPNCFYDLVIEVAIVRPGPIQGDMVHPYLRRRLGIDPVSYPSAELQEVLGKTYGVPLFQEQAMRIAIVAAGFSPDEADKLRRAMATFKRVGTIGEFRTKMIEGMVARRYDGDFAERCFKQIEGFGSYGFPESHAASFARLVYVSAWMKCYYPDVFACALINAQPMGFYAPAQLVRDAREHGVEVRDVDVNASDWDCGLEAPPFPLAGRGGASTLHPRHIDMADHIRTTYALRLGFRLVSGLAEEDMKKLVELRGRGYDSVRDVWLRTGLSTSVLETLAGADAFASLGLTRREALWAVRGLNRAGDKDDLPLLRPLSFRAVEPDAHLPPMPPGAEVIEDYRSLRLSLRAHPVFFVRRDLDARGVTRNGDLLHSKRAREKVAGLVLVRQRPGSASGVVFMTIEDETGVANAIIWPKLFEKLRATVIGARFVAISGKYQNESGVIHIVAEHIEDLTPLLSKLSRRGDDIETLARADEIRRPQHPRTKQPAPDLFAGEGNVHGVLPKGRNFQ